jgi:putative IMPACT (imprinted ancient) family translation regulator
VIVVRYFGGVLLGTSGLTNAYKQAAAEVLNNANVVEKVVEITIEANFDYIVMNDFMTILKEFQSDIKESNFDNRCQVTFCVRKQFQERVLEKLGKIEHLNIQLLAGNNL